jgi:hypothetical protein
MSNPKLGTEIPITSVELQEAIVRLVQSRLPLVTTRGRVAEEIRKALNDVERETKHKTIQLGLHHG